MHISKKSSTFAASKVKRERYMEDVVQRFISECQKNNGIKMSDEDIQTEVDAVRERKSYASSQEDIAQGRIEKFASADEMCESLGI